MKKRNPVSSLKHAEALQLDSAHCNSKHPQLPTVRVESKLLRQVHVRSSRRTLSGLTTDLESRDLNSGSPPDARVGC
eukprot:171240-Chlamydomonas_euryale.AAC.2